MRRRSRLTAAVSALVAAALALSGCTGTPEGPASTPAPTETGSTSPGGDAAPPASDSTAPAPGPAGGSTTPESSTREESRAPDAQVGRPEFRGRQPVLIAAGNAAYSDDPCEPTLVRLCDRDGVGGYILLGRSPERLHLTSIAMRPTRGATKWNVVLAMDDASAVRRAGRAAHSAGGLLLLLSPQRQVLATIRIEVLPFGTVSGARLRLFDMDKPEAWDLTEHLIDVLTEPTSLTP